MDLSGDTANIRYQHDGDMGLLSGSIIVFVIQDSGTWEEAHKRTPVVGESGCEVVISVDIYGDTDVIGNCADNDMGIDSGSGFF